MNPTSAPKFRQILPGFYALGLTDVEIIRDVPGALWEVRKAGQVLSLAATLREAKGLAVAALTGAL